MSQLNSIQFDVSAEGIKKSLIDMFAGAASVLREAAQNAHRAGATKFEITTSGKQIILSNDGAVMHDLDWKRLFHVGESGWNQETLMNESPFGIGSTSMLFCSTKIRIHSGYAVAEIDSEGFYSGTPVEINVGSEYFDGTHFVLDIKDEVWGDLKLNQINKTFAAFPIPVYFDGKCVPRPFSTGNETVQLYPFEYGHVAVDIEIAKYHTFCTHHVPMLYAQGLPTEIGNEYRGRTVCVGAVVHLDVNKVRPSVPDRTRLVDPPADLMSKAVMAIKLAFRDQLKINSQLDGMYDTLTEYYTLATSVAPDLFACPDAPLPSDSFFLLEAELIECTSDEFDENVSFQGARGDFVSADTLNPGYLSYSGLVEVNPIFSMESQLFSFALKQNLLILDARELPNQHAAIENAIDTDEVGGFRVEGENLSSKHNVNHEYSNFCISFHDGLTVYPPSMKTISGDLVQWESAEFSDDEYFFANDTLYVGRKCMSAGWLASRLSSFAVDDESEWYERDEEAESDSVDKLARLIKVLRGDSAEMVLSEILNKHRYELRQISQHIEGISFTVTFDADGYATFCES